MVRFVESSGLSVKTHPTHLVLDVAGTVAEVERALHVTLLKYNHPAEDRTFFAPDVEPSLDLQIPVLHIDGLSDYQLPRPASPMVPMNGQERGTGTHPTGAFWGYDFRKAYLPGITLDGSGQKLGLVEPESGFNAYDIAQYEDSTGLPPVPIKTVLVNYDGGLGRFPIEASLDIEMAIAMAPGLDTLVVYKGSPWASLFAHMASDTSVKQFSSSFLIMTDYPEQLYMQIAAQGQSFFNASGDDDAICYPSEDWRCGYISTLTPYATIVGGTELTTDSTQAQNYVSEAVWNGIPDDPRDKGSTGGYCDTIPIPSWQEGVANEDNQGSEIDRNIPDVAGVAAHIWCIFSWFWGNNWRSELYGTSAAAPLWGAMAALMNEQAAYVGRPPVGLLNPALYSICMGAAQNDTLFFNDITVGDNTSSGCDGAYYAVDGFDLCTGWGTPKAALIDTLVADISSVNGVARAAHLLAQVLPNPSGGRCQIRFTSTAPGVVTVRLFDAAGHMVRSLYRGMRPAGVTALPWDGLDNRGRELPPGVYFARVETPSGRAAGRLVVLR